MKSNLLRGLYLGIALVLGTQILTWLGQGLGTPFIIFSFGMVIIGIIFHTRLYKKEQGGKLSFWKAASSLIILILVSGFIFQLYMLVYTQFLDPKWVDNTAESWTQKMISQGQPDMQIKQTIDFFRKSYEPISIFTSSFLRTILPQYILGLLISLFFVFGKKPKMSKSKMKKKRGI